MRTYACFPVPLNSDQPDHPDHPFASGAGDGDVFAMKTQATRALLRFGRGVG